jgi:hypothetical protein
MAGDRRCTQNFGEASAKKLVSGTHKWLERQGARRQRVRQRCHGKRTHPVDETYLELVLRSRLSLRTERSIGEEAAVLPRIPGIRASGGTVWTTFRL